MKVLILGGNRYVGKRLAKLLLETGHEVTLLNRGNIDDGLGRNVERIRADKSDLSRNLGNRLFDVVVDQICMSEKDATNVVSTLRSHTLHYILTSTMAVYNQQSNLRESDFNPLHYTSQKGQTPLELYSEAKRSAEAVLAKEASFSWSVARFPIILGDDDPTRRLYEEISKIKNHQGVHYENINAFFSFVHASDAANALFRLCTHKHSGAYNFASETPIRISDFIETIEKKLGVKAIFDTQNEISSFSIKESWTLNCTKALTLGYEFQKISDFLPKLIS